MNTLKFLFFCCLYLCILIQTTKAQAFDRQDAESVDGMMREITDCSLSKPCPSPRETGENISPDMIDSCQESEEDRKKQEWINHGFNNPEFETLRKENFCQSICTHRFPFTAIAFRGGRWSSEIIKERLKKVKKLYGKCNISIHPIEIVMVDPPDTSDQNPHVKDSFQRKYEFQGSRDINYYSDNKPSKFNLAKITPSVQKPSMYFIGDFKDSTVTGTSGRSCKNRSGKYTNTTYVTEEVLESEYAASRGENFSTEAHELGHVLLNRGHYCDGHCSEESLTRDIEKGRDCCSHTISEDEEPYSQHNFMHKRSRRRNDSITEEQCEKIKENDDLVKLIR